MFARISSLFMFLFFALPLLAAASAVPRTGGPPATIPASQCNTGALQCCNSAQTSDNLTGPVKLLTGLLGLVLGPLDLLIGATCSPISVIGIGGNSCTAQPVCCTGNNFSGLIVLGCTPVNLNL